MPETQIPQQPLGRIALTFSGGGYRAASYNLGVLDYLNHISFQGKPLLQNVQILSTVSGGTITGAYYAYMLKQGYSFDQFFGNLWHFMRKEDLVGLALERLNNEEEWNPQKRRNLINAFAQIYQERLFDNASFGLFEDLYEDENHLEEVVFNATEFKNGLYFRFQHKGLCGNNYIWLNDGEKAELRLGDIVAASSCFPSGFEPLAFPTILCLRQRAHNLKY